MAIYRPRSNSQSSVNTDIWTYQDAVEHVLDLYDLDRTEPRSLRRARSAVLTAYRDLPHKHRWSAYQRRVQFVTEASYNTGTTAYDQTGGTYERMLTLTGGTWPTNAAFGEVIISDNIYPVDTRESNTQITLRPDHNPGADIAAGTSYTWFRSRYPLRVGFIRGTKLVELGNTFFLEYRSPGEFVHTLMGNYQPQRPMYYTLRNDEEYYGETAVELGPPPSSIRTYDMMAEVRPRELLTEKYSTGDVTLAAGATAVTGTTTAFTDKMVGSIIRFTTSTTNEPTGLPGSPVNDLDNPYLAQRVITAVSSGTALTIDSAVDSSTTFTNTKYTISDPIDMESGAMFTYFLRLCEAEFGNLIQSEDFASRKGLADLQLRSAAAADSRNKDFGDGRRNYFTHWKDLAIIE